MNTMKAALVAAAILSPTAVSASYSLVKEYSGTNFFNGWSFYDYYDNTTSGDVEYVNQTYATSDKLAYVNSAGAAIIKVDNTSFVEYNYKRNSVRITTEDYFALGSVVLFDAAHLPYGCSIWPSFWTKGENWPVGGEIDIVEAVNEMIFNQVALHTEDGCTATSGVSASGTLSATNCSSAAGCTYAQTQPNTFGEGFASAGGGVWATLFDTSGIAVWFWSRSDIPSSVSSANSSIDISNWGTPTANYTPSSCNIDKYFTPQQLVLDITLCGDWAGLDTIYTETCTVSGGAANASSCYLQNVINNGNQTALSQAYFEINYIKAFNANGTIVSASGSSSSVSPTSTAAGSSGSSSSNKSSSSGAGRVAAQLTALVGAVGALSFWTLL